MMMADPDQQQQQQSDSLSVMLMESQVMFGRQKKKKKKKTFQEELHISLGSWGVQKRGSQRMYVWSHFPFPMTFHLWE